MSKVGRSGVVTLEEGKSAENSLYVVEGIQFDRGYISPYFVTDSEKMSVEYENCKLLLVDKKVGAQTETELKEKKLRVEDALNATKAAVEEGIVVGGGCTLLRLASKVDTIRESLENDEQKIGSEIVKRALSYPLKLIAKNAGVNGSVVVEKVLSIDNPKYGYNAATGKYEDLMAAGIIDPTKVASRFVTIGIDDDSKRLLDDCSKIGGNLPSKPFE
ncbi:hypothetical protein HPP92_014746 [Vanilla planifolia]|uniref:Uncharacterized protein n=1 Tax=Vanilla planifolia TaxID=51239 RepID=A0A835QN91_VANPL|nr:hypothetical protein HPP92_014746 [Vanilla planifolia]